MKVLVQFDPAYAGPPSDAVWLIAGPENRSWFVQHRETIDASSAIFDEEAEPLQIIWHVFGHHPDWTEITVCGAAPTPEIEKSVEPDADIANRGVDGFKLARR